MQTVVVNCMCGQAIRLPADFGREDNTHAPESFPLFPFPGVEMPIQQALLPLLAHESSTVGFLVGGEPSRFDFDSEMSSSMLGSEDHRRGMAQSPLKEPAADEQTLSRWELSERESGIEVPTTASETARTLERASQSLVESKTRHIEEHADQTSQRLILMLVATGILIPAVIGLGYFAVRTIQGTRSWSNEILENMHERAEQKRNRRN